MDSTCFINRLTPAQRTALYDQARRDAVQLRREAMSDAADWLVARSRALWQRALAGAAPPRTAGHAPCAR